MANTPSDLSSWQKLIDANPLLQNAVRQAAGSPNHRYDWAKIVAPALRQSQIELPNDVGLLPSGKVYERSVLQRHPWIVPAVGIAAGVTGGAALGAFGAAGGGAGAGAAAGAAGTGTAAGTGAAAAGAGAAGIGAGMDPYIWGSIIQALGGMGASALAPQPQRRQGYTGDVSAQRSLEQSNDFLNTLRMTLEGLPPLDLSGSSAPLPNDPGGRVPTPQRRPMQMATSNVGPMQTSDRTQGALALLRSLGVAA